MRFLTPKLTLGKGAKGEATIMWEITNTSQKDVYICTHNNPLESPASPQLSIVDSHGTKAKYMGMYSQREAPRDSPDDWCLLQSGTTLSRNVELNVYCRTIQQSENYTCIFNQLVYYADFVDSNSVIQCDKVLVTSNAINLHF